MYKIIIADKYKLYRKGIFVEDFNTIAQLAEYCFDIIRHSELDEAIKWISDTNHNTIEFGIYGYFTISYYDNTVEE